MNEKLHLTPQEAANKSGQMYDDHLSIAETIETNDLLAKESAKRIIEIDSQIAFNPMNPPSLPAPNRDERARLNEERESEKHKLDNSAGYVYEMHELNERGLDVAQKFASENAGELHDAAVAMATLEGVKINVDKKSTDVPVSSEK